MTEPSYVCPRCGSESFHPVDVHERYCGRCHVFEDDTKVRGDTLSMWTIYDHPRDYPDVFVARRFEIGNRPAERLTSDVITAPSLERLRDAMRERGLTALPRSDDDDPVIVETWL